MYPSNSLPDQAGRIYTVDVNLTDPVQLARRLSSAATDDNGRPCLLIDCQRLGCLRTRGVSFLVSQLLLTRAAGADVLLYHVGPVLERALRLLHLDQLFQLWPAALGSTSNRVGTA
ncbi:STAS domain-containing protein [Hymenobacter psychrotolerans]|uniref:STAS domain-containing protein n=1 Tax=Hymenobacter psychrotolerans DSM 18569 TaxID=1121959 RepID=A0A1M6UCD3_9BACT|nr:hypothetical protein [Hymenobacter psychrotolerans]SHK66821.1 hypothetical protein SAMN02746009_01313 [Hymenobacter psychrotolerans DSM 18569]